MSVTFSTVSIWNLALQRLGVPAIQDVNDGSVAAGACNLCYDFIRQSELEEHPWAFAIEQHALPADSPGPTWGRAKSFQLPSGFLRLLEDYPEDQTWQRDYLIEGQKIVTDWDGPLYVRCVMDVIDPNKMHALFREAVALKMANQMCEALTQSRSKKKDILDDYVDTIRRAKRSQAIQKPAHPDIDDTWVTAREQ